MPAVLRFFCFLLLFPTLLRAQAPQCTGPSYAQLHVDAAGRDVRLTCLIGYQQGSPTGGMLVGGMIGGDLYLSRRGPQGGPALGDYPAHG